MSSVDRMPPPIVKGMKTCEAQLLVARSGDIEEYELIGPLPVIARRELDRVAGIAQPYEIRALHDTAIFDIETWYDAFRIHIF